MIVEATGSSGAVGNGDTFFWWFFITTLMPLVLGERKFITLLATERPLEVEYLALPLRWSGRDKPEVLNMIKVTSIVCGQRSIETQRRRSDPRVLGAQ